MPYKERLREESLPKKRKVYYRPINWPEYNRALKERGSLTLWIDKDIEKHWYAKRPAVMRQGRPLHFSDECLTIMLTLRLVFGTRLRQTEGFVNSLFTFGGIDLEVPEYTRLSKRGVAALACRRLEDMENPGHIVIDSTGVKVFGKSEWLETKHGKQYRRKIWRKLHVGVSESKLIVSRVMTDHITDDRTPMETLIDQAGPGKVTEVIADTGYDGEQTYQKLEDRGIKTVIPPPHGSKVSSQDHPTTRDEVISYINEKGVYAWQNKNEFGRRAKVENTFYRFKTIFGRNLKARSWNNQDAELHLACCVLNQFTKKGMPKYGKTA